MGFPSLLRVEEAIQGLNYKNVVERDLLVRTDGFWHVLIALRHIRLHNLPARSFEVRGYDLAEACFDVNGIGLPIEQNSRDVYYEPAARSGNPSAYFRHREGPRQTYLNRIQTGLSGRGPRQPHLFTLTSQTLPTTVTLVENWLEAIRSFEDHKFLLDTRTSELLAFIFRFGLPELNGSSTSIATHGNSGSMVRRDGIAFQPIEPGTFSAKVKDFFGLTDNEFNVLLPNFGNIDHARFFGEDEVIGLQHIPAGLRQLYPATETQAIAINPTPTNTTLNWEDFDQATSNTTFIGAPDILQKCVAALKSGKNLLLLGPPGGGKTLLAKELCQFASSSGVPGYVVTTATSEWSTFETIGGYMPSQADPNRLEFTPGIVTSAIISHKWLLIDEFNRADIDKAFGEMFTLLSGHKIQLSFSKDNKPICIQLEDEAIDDSTFAILLPKSWRMIATMNTFDKSSLFQMSYALMRRFAFVDVDLPSSDILRSIVETKLGQVPVDEQGKQFILSVLDAFFSSDSPDGLCEINLQLGPAIALDMLAYLQARLTVLPIVTQDDVVSTLFEATQMYVFPQFEGRDMVHPALVEMINRIGFSGIGEEVISKKLSIWTGYEEG